MKVKYFALAAVLALVFTGCSANREETSSDSVPPTNSVGTDRDGYVSPDIDSNAYNSDGLICDGPSAVADQTIACLLYTSPSPRDA